MTAGCVRDQAQPSPPVINWKRWGLVEGAERHHRPSGSGTTPIGVGFLFFAHRRLHLRLAMLLSSGQPDFENMP